VHQQTGWRSTATRTDGSGGAAGWTAARRACGLSGSSQIWPTPAILSPSRVMRSRVGSGLAGKMPGRSHSRAS